MNMIAAAGFDERLPTQNEIDSAAEALTAIANSRNPDGSLTIYDATLSASLADLINDLLSIIARGQTVTLAPLSRMLTTQEAADLLNVSRPYLIKLIKEEALDCEMTGTHRRLRLGDVLAYKEQRSQKRRDALQEMQDIAEDIEDL